MEQRGNKALQPVYFQKDLVIVLAYLGTSFGLQGAVTSMVLEKMMSGTAATERTGQVPPPLAFFPEDIAIARSFLMTSSGLLPVWVMKILKMTSGHLIKQNLKQKNYEKSIETMDSLGVGSIDSLLKI
jgi:hypothetical protein